MLSFVFFLLFATHSYAAVQISVQEVGGASQFQFQGQAQWVYELTTSRPQLVELKIARLGEPDAKRLAAYQSPLFEKIEVVKDTETRSLVRFFLRPDVESFDYKMEEPSRLVIDFFIDEAKKKKRLAAAKQAQARKLASDTGPKLEPSKTAEQLALEQREREKQEMQQALASLGDSKLGNFDGGDPDFERFKMADYEIKESAIIASRKNIYIQYPFLIESQDILRKLLESPPIYEIKYHDREESKQAILLKELFEKKRYAVFITTLKFFRSSFPKSRYTQILRYLEADTYYALWLRDKERVDLQKSLVLYEALLKDFPESPLAERTRMLVAYSYYDIGDNFGALKNFIQILNTDPNTKYKNDLRISIGDVYRDLNKYEDALDTYKVIYLDEAAKDKRIEAKYKIGDVYARRKDYAKAIAAYREAIKEFPEQAKLYPNAFYNIAESEFWLGEYQKSLDSYIKYVRNYPKSEHGGYALTRIGEILEILGAEESKFKGAYLESWFRFRSTQGADIARIRFISHLMPQMKDKAVDAAHREVDAYVQKSKLPFMKEFATVILADGYYKRGELDKSLFLLEEFYKNNSTSTALDLFRDRIVKTLTRQVEQKVENQKYVEAIQSYGKHAGTWLRDSQRLDLRYALGKSFEKAGVLEEASKIYQASINRLYALEGTEELKEKQIFENLPSIGELNLRLAAVHQAQEKWQQARKYLEKCQEREKELDQDLQVEVVLVASKIDEGQGRYIEAADAVKKLLDTWKGKPELVQEPLYRMAHLMEQSGQIDKALVYLDKLEALHKDSSLVQPKLRYDARIKAADLHLQRKDSVAAQQIYEELIAAEDQESGIASVRYKLGEIYFQQGQLKKAKDIWTSLQTRQDAAAWYSLARDKMESKEWEEQYNKYLKRLPASRKE